MSEGDKGTADDIAHVVARTAGANRKYFYRRYEDGLWSPWEQIKLDIEDNPVIPVVWKDRLFLFWLKILKQVPVDPPELPPTGELGKMEASTIIKEVPKVNVQAVLCWSEYYNGKWQPAKTSDINEPIQLSEFPAHGIGIFDRSTLRLSVFEKPDGLRVSVAKTSTDGWFADLYSAFFLYNTHSSPQPEKGIFIEETLGPNNYPVRLLDTWSDELNVLYKKELWAPPIKNPLLENKIADRAVEPHHWFQSPWRAPFFYEDRRHVFYVTTKEVFVRPQKWPSYHITIASAVYALKSPLIMEEYKPPGPDPYEFGPIGLDDPSSMKRFVSEDAYIKKGITLTSTVRLGGATIGPAGRVVNVKQEQ